MSYFPNGRRMVAVAWAAMPSPRPMKPSPSLVVALTATRSTAMPQISAMRRRMASRCGPIFGASAMIDKVEMDDDAAARGDPPGGVRQEPIGGCAFPLRVGGREMRADVAVGERAEDRVGQGVQPDVGVGVADEAAIMRDRRLPPSTTSVAGAEGMDVVAGADARFAGSEQALRSAGAARQRRDPRGLSV